MNVTIQQGDYAFNTTTGVVTITGEWQSQFNAENLKYIANSTSGTELYNPLCGVLGTVTNNTVNVDLNTSAMDSGDVLWIQLTVLEEAVTIESLLEKMNTCQANMLEQNLLTNELLKQMF